MDAAHHNTFPLNRLVARCYEIVKFLLKLGLAVVILAWMLSTNLGKFFFPIYRSLFKNFPIQTPVA